MAQSNVPPAVAQKLSAIRRRAFAITLLAGLAWSGATLLAVMLAAMILDWLAGWLDPRVRYAVTFLALAVVAVAFVRFCARPLLSRRTIVATARQVDDSIPQLEERWSTVTELSQSTDAPAVRGSDAMIRQVADEADAAGAAISAAAIVSTAPLRRAARWLIGAAALLAALLVFNFAQGSRLFARFWMPGRDISLTQVSATPAGGWAARGEPLTLNAAVRGRLPSGPARLFVRPEHGQEKRLIMTSKAGSAGAYQHVIDPVEESFDYRVQSGDGQTAWSHITAVDRPRISEVRLKVMPPAYSKLPADEKNALPSSVRILEGSDLEVSFRSDQPLDRMLLDFGNGQSARLAAGKDNWFTFRSTPTNSFSFAAAAINRFQLENKNKPSCRISLYEDLPPSVKILEPSDDLAVLPGEKVNVTFEASDDFGLSKAEVKVETTTADGETNHVTLPVDLGADAGGRHLRRTVQLDPKMLGLKHGDKLSYVVEVTDTKQVPAQAGAEAGQPPPAPAAETANAGEQRPAGESPEHRESKAGTNAAATAQSDPPPQNPAEAGSKDTPPDKQSNKSANSSALAATARPSSPTEQKQNQGSQPPPNDMARRMLDAAQTSSCKPRNIQVDEWAGSFEGEKRKKLEIAIEPVLRELDKLLETADSEAGSLKTAAASAGGLDLQHAAVLVAARSNLSQAVSTVIGLKKRTSGTPYAFVGLQLHNINEAHITPAGSALAGVAIPATPENTNAAQLQSASYHIKAARSMLADLSRTFETVKRDQRIADAMQKVNKMYQIFLEDTQALLGASKGAINSHDRKIAEVDEQFVEKLKELLEQKKKVMDELAALLADDPRLLRRYLAMTQLEATSYRDQLTLLAERQKQIQQQVAAWNGAPENERPALIPQLRQSHAASQREIVRASTTLRENMETWLPLDIKATDKPVKSMLVRAEKIAALAAENAVAVVSGTNAGPAGSRLAAELNGLRDDISGLQGLTDQHPGLSAYIVNRSAEIDSLQAAEQDSTRLAEAFAGKNFARASSIVQDRITQDTVKLSQKLEATQTQVARLSPEIADAAKKLTRTVKTQIIFPQLSAAVRLEGRDMESAAGLQKEIVPAFERAENQFDALLELIIAKLDEAPPPNEVGQAPAAEDLLKMLQNEQKAAEGLGIPPRPLNVNIMRDWMKPGSSGQNGAGRGRAQAQAAQQQAKDASREAQRLEKKARESSQQALAAAREGGAAGNTAAAARGENWNRLASRLQKDLLQGRDNTPPEQYRAAIENYFRILSEQRRDVESK